MGSAALLCAGCRMERPRPRPRVPCGPLQCLVVGDPSFAGPVLVFLHGYGLDPGVVPDLPYFPTLARGATVVMPRGRSIADPERPPHAGPTWFDIPQPLHNLRHRAPPGVRAAQLSISAVLDHITSAHRVPPSRLVIGGISQGAALALETVLADPRPLAGVVSLSAPLMDERSVRERASARAGLPVFMAHGRVDILAPFSFATELAGGLRDGGVAVEWAPHERGHDVPLEIAARARGFIERVTGPRTAPSPLPRP